MNFSERISCIGLVCFCGFKFRTAMEYRKLKQMRPNSDRKTLRRILSLLPLNPEYDKIFSDRLTTQRVLPDLAEHFPAIYAVKIDNRAVFYQPGTVSMPLLDANGILNLLRQEKSMLLEKGRAGLDSRLETLCFEEDTYRKNGKPIAEDKLIVWLEKLPEESVFFENILDAQPENYPMVHVSVLNRAGQGPCIAHSALFYHGEKGECFRCGYQAGETCALRREEEQLALSVAGRFPEIEYLGFSFVRGSADFRIFAVDTGLTLACYEHLPPVLADYVAERYGQKPAGGWKRLKKYLFSWRAKRHGFVDFMYRNWLAGLKEDKGFLGTSRREKRWAHKRGFYSWRIRQYNLTGENYRDVLSDYDYKRLRPINNSYYKWFWNKKISSYILQRLENYVPKCYFWTDVRDGEWIAYPFLQSERKGVEDILSLLRAEGALAMKPAEGSHGKGFHALRYENGTYYLNSCPVTEEALRQEIFACGGDMLVTEYVHQHDMLAAIYPNVVNTVRIMTIRDESGRFIKAAYLRVGTKSTGNTDNLASGGIAATVDLESGRICTPMKLANHVYTPCERHPDTGAPIEGVLPHWDAVKQAIEEVCRDLSPLEYLGFDVAITAESFKILEINTHQDLQWYTAYPAEVKAFFRRKLAEKKSRARR